MKLGALFLGFWDFWYSTMANSLRRRLTRVFSSSRQGFGRQSNRGNGNGNNSNNQPKANGSQNSSPTTFTPPPNSTTNSPSLPSMSSSDTGMANVENHPGREPPKPFFFREKYATLGVKGNFMPLAAQPRYVDLGEWLAHQGELFSTDITEQI